MMRIVCMNARGLSYAARLVHMNPPNFLCL